MPEDLLTQGPPATPAAAPEAPAAPAPPTMEQRIAALNPQERQQWELHGDLPKELTPAASSPAAETQPAPSPGAPNPAEGAPAATPETPAPRERRNAAHWDDLTAQLGAARREIELLRASQQAPAAPASAPVTDPAARPAMPTPSESQTWAEYQQSIVEWQREDTAWVQRQIEGVHQRIADQSVTHGYAAQEEAARKEIPDYDEALKAEIPISDFVMQAIPRHKHGARLSYYLSKNPAEAERISRATEVPAGLNWVQQERARGRAEERLAMEFERITASFKGNGVTTPPKTLLAAQPPPSASVNPRATSAPPQDALSAAIAKGDQREFNRIMDEQDIASGRRR